MLVRVARPSPPLVPAQAGTQSRRREPLIFAPWIPAPRSAEAKPLRLRGGECAGMSGKCCSPARRSPSSSVKQPLANAPPPVLFEAPGRPPSIPRFRGGKFLPLDNSRGMERLEAHQSCVIRAAFWTARAPLGAPLAAFSFDAGSALCVSPLRLAFGRDRDPLRAAAASMSRANLGGSASASSWRGVCSAPGQSPASPEGRLTRPARGRRIHRGFCTPAPGGRMPHLRHRPHPGGSAIRIVSR